jgi:hypothetical protein
MSSGNRYSLASHGVGSNREPSQNKVLRPDVRGMNYYGLNYADNGTNVFRIWPNYSTDEYGNKVWTPFRNSLDIPMDFGDWIRRYPVARKVAGTHLTFIIGDPSREYDFSHKPINVLYNALTRAIDAGQEQGGWARLKEKSKNGALLSPSTFVYFVQCGLFWHGTKSAWREGKGFPGVHPDSYAVLMELTDSAGRGLLTEMDKRRADASADAAADDFESRFVNGDPISWEHGRFVTFYKKTDGDPRVRRAWAGQSATSMQTWGDANNQKRGELQGGYECFLEPTTEIAGQGVMSAITPPDFQTAIANKIRAWDDILYFPSEIEQAHLIAPLYPADLILYAFADHPEWIPEGLRSAAVNAQSVAVPRGLPTAMGNPMRVPPQVPAATPPAPRVPQVNTDPVIAQMATPAVGFGSVTAVPPGFSPMLPGVVEVTPASAATMSQVPQAAPPPALAAVPGIPAAPATPESAAAKLLDIVRSGKQGS